MAAGGASIVSALVVNPLDVVKVQWAATRLQIQRSPTHSVSAYAQEHALLERWSFAECGPAGQARASFGAGGPLPFSGTADALWRIARGEGLRALWRGTGVSLAMSVPMVGIYLPLYDALLSLGQGAAWAPLAAGTLSRTAAVLVTAPLELARTRLQARPRAALAAPGAAPCADCACGLGGGAAAGAGVRGLWRGVGSQLARDVPFSALYWGLVEPLRAALAAGQPDDPGAVLRRNVAAGAAAGALAGAVTTPLDVVKTRVQVAGERGEPPSIARAAQDLGAGGRARALPRLERARRQGRASLCHRALRLRGHQALARAQVTRPGRSGAVFQGVPGHLRAQTQSGRARESASLPIYFSRASRTCT
ncbi:hypothetical protein QBZ16_004128 [Prototheca wickerhamii]|uniref:Uncharacterized protein n=1 Tax=Prototheca wickerhamii TaxID=3111 RepID=A0AAD9IGV8_PROWI|nr:hypothetical protein QBZ16_004128 [Prototheca wickerhamii]